MTLAVMKAFGARIDVEQAGGAVFIPAPQCYRAADYPIEPDASAASYFWAAAAITNGQVTVEGLSRSALQGDVRFVDVLEKMGCSVDWQADSITVTGVRCGESTST